MCVCMYVCMYVCNIYRPTPAFPVTARGATMVQLGPLYDRSQSGTNHHWSLDSLGLLRTVGVMPPARLCLSEFLSEE